MSPQEYEWLTEAQEIELQAWRELGAQRARERLDISRRELQREIDTTLAWLDEVELRIRG